MNLKTYHAFTMAEALAAVKQDLGHDAVILHTRSFKRGGVLGVGRRTVVEVTATPADQSGPRRPAVARRDAPRRAAAGRAYAALPSADRGDAASRGAAEPTARGEQPARGRPWTPERLEQVRRRIDHHRARAAAAAGPHDGHIVTGAPIGPAERPTAGPAGPSPSPSPTPPRADAAEPAGDRGGRPRQPVAQRFILQPAAGDPGASPPAGAASTRPKLPAEVPTASPAAAITEPKPAAPGVRGGSGRESMQEELAAIRRMVGQVLERQQSPAPRPLADLPAPLMDHYMSLTGQELAAELAERVLRRVAEELPTERLADAEAVRAATVEALASVVPVAAEPLAAASPDGRPLTVALVGPTGVGKTTTLAKLAAVLKLRRGKRVGLVTADTYRIAAVDQLRTYANIIGLPLEIALTPAEMRQSVHTLSDCDVVLIDTAGRSQNDRRRIDELQAYLDAAEPHEVHLVLSCTASERVMRHEAEAFGAVGVHKVAVTKLDEAASFGVIVNVLNDIDLSLSFLTTGQEVPDHIEPGRARRLAELLMGAPVRS
ncbi:MAG: flagellar biosynthesis protein FlhF [Planctomycetota bacterium]